MKRFFLIAALFVLATPFASAQLQQLSGTDRRVVRKLLELLRAGERKRGDEQCSDKEKSLHNKVKFVMYL